MRFVAPSSLYKYKPLSTSGDLASVLDIIIHKKIYAPTQKQLNDPMEGCGVVHTGHYAGFSIPLAVERQGKGYNHASSYRTVSLTELAASPQMWAHYGGGYTGVCIQLCTEQLPFEIVPVHYAKQPVQMSGELTGSEYDIDAISRGALATKHADWAYEQEWRGIFKGDETNPDGFVSCGEDNPTAVIVGSECEEPTLSFVREVCGERKIPVYRTYISNWTQKVRLLPFELEIQYDGIPLRTQVENYCKMHGAKDLNLW